MTDSVCLGNSDLAPTTVLEYLGLRIGSSIKGLFRLYTKAFTSEC